MKILLTNSNPLSECYLRYIEDLQASDKYDAITTTEDIRAFPDYLERYKNLLVIERGDSAEIRNRKVIAHPSVTTFVKMYSYTDLKYHNDPSIGGRVFLETLATEEEFKEHAKLPLQVSEKDFAKIQFGFNFLHYTRLETLFEMLKKTEIKDTLERPIDYFFAGTVEYNKESISGRLISAHRESWIRSIEQHREKGFNVEVHRSKKLNFTQFVDKLLNTKYIVSPFGWGEMCYRDYEAELCGCTVVKSFHHPISAYPRGESLVHDKINEHNVIKELLK